MSPAIVEKVRAEIGKSLDSPEMRSRLDTAGFQVANEASPKAFSELLVKSADIYKKIVAQAGIEPE